MEVETLDDDRTLLLEGAPPNRGFQRPSLLLSAGVLVAVGIAGRTIWNPGSLGMSEVGSAFTNFFFVSGIDLDPNSAQKQQAWQEKQDAEERKSYHDLREAARDGDDEAKKKWKEFEAAVLAEETLRRERGETVNFTSGPGADGNVPDPCDCKSRWEYDEDKDGSSETFQGCHKTSDSEDTWCYVVDGWNCPEAQASGVEGVEFMWRECKAAGGDHADSEGGGGDHHADSEGGDHHAH